MPLILESPDHQQRLELTIVGYEFPAMEGDEYDALQACIHEVETAVAARPRGEL